MTIRKAPLAVAAAASAMLLAGCGYHPADRAVSGGLIGAGTGAGVAAIAGGNVGTGAIVGGVAGAAAGALTRPDQINLGRPLWRR